MGLITRPCPAVRVPRRRPRAPAASQRPPRNLVHAGAFPLVTGVLAAVTAHGTASPLDSETSALLTLEPCGDARPTSRPPPRREPRGPARGADSADVRSLCGREAGTCVGVTVSFLSLMFICTGESTPRQGRRVGKEPKGFPSEQAATRLPACTCSSKLQASPTHRCPDSQGEVTARSLPAHSQGSRQRGTRLLAQCSARCVLNSCLTCCFQ